jgi:hypothetical protein
MVVTFAIPTPSSDFTAITGPSDPPFDEMLPATEPLAASVGGTLPVQWPVENLILPESWVIGVQLRQEE